MTPDRREKQEQALQECLDQLQQPEQSLEAALAQHSRHAEALRPELETARWLQERRPALAPRPGFVAASQRRVLARIEVQGGLTPASKMRWSFASLRYPSTWRHYIPRLALVYLLLVALLLNAGRITTASLKWLPGDVGYPVKLAMEGIALLATPSPAGDARLHIQFAQRRLLEAQALVLESRFDQIPATVANFGRHVQGAVSAVDRVAQQDRGQAHELALDLQRVFSKQMPLVVLLSGFTPADSRADFQLVLSIAEDGVSAMEKVLDQGNSGASGFGAAFLQAREMAYNFVR